jgi:pilus assembly protein CpaF
LRPPTDALAVVQALQAELTGAGVLQPLLADPGVTDVLVHAGGKVWVDRGEGLREEQVLLGGETEVRRLAVRLIAASGRRLDAAQPYADAVLPDGHRVHAVLPPLAVDGTCLSLRAHRRQGFDLSALAAAGTLPGASLPWLEAALSAGLSMVITGATGSGKTTLLGALLQALPSRLRLVLVEDESEVRAMHPQLVRLQTRPANLEGVGAVTLRDLLRQALRMRPDRLVLGEVRGPEVLDLFTALNTGHEGALATLHANSPAEVPARVEALGALGGLPRLAVHSLLGPALQLVLHLVRGPAGRVLSQVGVLAREPNGEVRCTAALLVGGAPLRSGPALPALRELLISRAITCPGEPT